MPATLTRLRVHWHRMTAPQDSREIEIVRSWHGNARAWSDAIRTSSIASRQLVTNQAILDAIASVAPDRVLDVGCGEGWLARAIAKADFEIGRNTDIVGLDIVPELIARAAALGGAEFQVRDYAVIANRAWHGGRFDAVVCNFSLLGNESVESLIAAAPYHLNDSGHLIIQTLHPIAACRDLPYQDGWRVGDWQGFGSEFKDPAPWYFRTVESWSALLRRCQFEILECREPRAPGAVAPASIIWICREFRR
jgi:2-polyprenyl-3-methyl-5-hydroxy-6-metoxy-1,4-benzoquinol methylase